MNIVAIVQARMKSTRLPGKVMKLIDSNTPVIKVLLSRLSQSKEIDKVVVATSTNSVENPLVEYVTKLGYEVFLGSEHDVLDRYYKAAQWFSADVIVRITGDCPLIDPKIVDEIINMYKSKDIDYLSNTITPTYPDGLDVEVFSFSSLKSAWNLAKTPFEREHVTPYIKDSSKFKIKNFYNSKDYSSERWTLDEIEDYDVIKSIVDSFSSSYSFSWKDVLKLKEAQPKLFLGNKHIVRNEGGIMGSGQKLWKRAKKIIPGGNMLLSKRAEMFLPGKWPAYFSKAKGCKIWDMDGHEYIDMSIMGIGTNILGYGHQEVDDAVKKIIIDGNMSTLNCPEEVYLSEKLIELHPWADMVRLAKTGGEANAIAIRIARAYSGKDKVAICGYHGWHDWYLSANLSDDNNLDGHLLPGLNPIGVPKELQGSVIPFNYNKINELEDIVRNNDIGVIKMEVSRNIKPQDNFLSTVREIANNNNIVLIFDECTSGFRLTNGGLHKLYEVEPDMAIFGKALGNGYSITAVIGRRRIMDVAEDTFISSTFWTERIGPAAALKTMEIMNRERSWETITNIGNQIGKGWKKTADRYQLPIIISGLPSMIGFSIESNDWLKYKTLITQEMLKQNILASNVIYVSTAHNQKYIDNYFQILDTIFKKIKDCEEGYPIDSLLDGPICHDGFQRLN